MYNVNFRLVTIEVSIRGRSTFVHLFKETRHSRGEERSLTFELRFKCSLREKIGWKDGWMEGFYILYFCTSEGLIG